MKIRLVLVLIGLFQLRAGAMGQLRAENSNYVVIGAFSSETNAQRFTKKAKKQHFDASFQLNLSRHLFYVFVLHTPDKQIAIDQALKLRKETSYWDTWVFSGILGDDGSQTVGIDTHPETGEKINIITPEDRPELLKETASKESQLPIEEKNSSVEAEGGVKKFLFKLFRTASNEPLDGEVDVINIDNNKKATSVKGNEEVVLKPFNKSGNVALECEVFGYKKIKRVINLVDPQSAEDVAIDNGKIIVPFEFIRLQKGDKAIMYNVYFYKDAAIMRPESHYEVESLLEMLKENPNYEIRIHGHTNGNAAGKIIRMGDSKDFFSLNGSKEGFGSAKKLSEERAMLIYNFLVSQGIDSKRMQVKAWGGKKPIYDKHHAQAHVNVRVEIEILKN